MSIRKPASTFAIVSFVIVLSMLLAACSSGGENKTQVNSAAPTATAPPGSSPATPGSNAAKAKLNVNSATKDELLQTIPGMGNKMVHEFEEYRPYRSIQQFRKEIGKYVSPDVVTEYEKYIFVPIDENQSDAPTLQQIPGLDAAEAQQLISGRPYASRDAFISKLGEKVTAAELVIARSYLVQP